MKRREFLKIATLNNVGIMMTPSLLSFSQEYKNSITGKIKIGQIGISHEHALPKFNALKMLSDIYEFVGLVNDRSSEAARFVGDNLKQFEGVKWMSEDELFNVKGLHAVMIETANSDLVPTAIRSMEHNLSIHMDKPGGEDIELFGKLIEGCKERNLVLQMGYMFRNNPAMQFCQNAIRENWLGEIFEVQGNMSHNYGGGTPYEQYLGNFKGGIMFNLGCHIIDMVVSMLGTPVKVTPFLKATEGAPEMAKNNCLAVLEYPHALVSVNACDLKIDGINQRYFKIFGSKGSIELSPLERFDGKPLQLQLVLKEGNSRYTAGSHVIETGIQDDRYKAQLIELGDIIKGEMENPYTLEHDYITQRVVMAASGFNVKIN